MGRGGESQNPEYSPSCALPTVHDTTSAGAMLGALQALSATYNRAHARRPLTTSMALGAVIAGTGDLVCQYQEKGSLLTSGALDGRRVAELSLTRALVMAPFLYVYFPLLARLIPGDSWARVLARVVADTAIGAPISLCIIFAGTSTLKGRPQDTLSRIQDRLLPTWYLGAHYWPFIHILNFKVVPPGHQGLVAHFASVWWMIQISAASNKRLVDSPLAE